MKKFYILLIITVLANVALAQMKTKELDAIKNDTTLFFGLSRVSRSADDATDDAKEQLYANIAKNCGANAIYVAENLDVKTQLENIIKTFRAGIEEKMEDRIVIENEDNEEYQNVVYLKRSDFRAMCDERLNSIQRYISKGIKAEDEESFEDALKSYYWALILTYAHPQGRKLRFHGESGTIDHEWLIDRISGSDGILRSFNFIVPKDNGIEETDKGMLVKLKVTKKSGEDVANLRCECHDGRAYIPYTVSDGKLIVNLCTKEIKSFKIKINYDFKDDAKKANPEVSSAIDLIKVPRFSNNIYTVNLDKVEFVKKDVEVEGWSEIEKNRAVDEAPYLKKMAVIENALRKGDITLARDCFSKEGYNMLDTLSHYGKMRMVGKPEYKFLHYKDEVICRSILMQFEFKNTVGFSQEVVFRFDPVNQVVTSIAFRLSNQSEYDIISKTKWPEESRLILVNFLEDYQTAYALKRHKYLESIYSDDALIIVGRFVKKTEIPDRLTLKLTAEQAELTKYDKDTYMKNLSACFKNNEYIRLRFTETDFTKANNNPDVYGVRVRQEYFSSSYGDVGYLFLLVDLRGAMPLIHVRAWQPDKVDLDKLMNMSDVRFN